MTRVRVNIPFKARSVATNEYVLFPKGTVLWHVEIAKDVVSFQEIGGQGLYEIPEDEFTPNVRNISR
ncbi:MAG: hypothetical protein JO336_20535 [Acidobacteriia bacterium]|nr:hypothetical protein [Terriglobia bacterium]MBV9742654.1 hypothetical protein [Terriglobia bacterium]